MTANPYDSYLESQVLTASPVELVELLYRAAIDAVGSARRHLAAGDIMSRAAAVTRAAGLVGELVQSLDMDNGGAIARDLRDLYDYILRRIQAGNFEQRDEPLAEAERLLTTLADAWRTVAGEQRNAVEFAPPVYEEDGAGVSSLSLSL